ncbi:MAG: DegT/DnrJ/EryC1/StrS family aminotransferase [Sandaracinaceae bacterium]
MTVTGEPPPPDRRSPYVHPTAVIDGDVELGLDTKVWHFVHVSSGARIGAGCVLGQNVFVGRGVRLGSGVRVQNSVSIYEGVTVDDDAFLGPSCVFTNVHNPRSFIPRKDEYRTTRVGRGATVGANAVVVCGNDLGAYCFVGAGAVVTRDVPPYALVLGNPARRVGWMSRAGRRLPEGDVVACPETGERYRIEGEACTPLDDPAQDEGPIPILDLQAQNGPLRGAIRAALDRVIANNAFILGSEVKAFEEEAAAFLDVPHAIGVSSGTDALLVALMALGVGPGDEVVTTPFSFFATAGVIHRLGARPVFVDIDPATYNLDPSQVAGAITPRTKAILPVHLYGQPCDWAALADVAGGVPIVEDAAQAIGAEAGEGRVGGLGRLACFSFYPSKNLGAFGDGGLVTTRDADLAEKVRRLRVHGAHPKYFHATVGGNFRLDALQAAVLRVKLPHLPRWTDARRRNATRYDRLFAEAGLPAGAVTTPVRRSAGHVYNQYVIRAERRDELQAHLKRQGIGTVIYYPRPLHLQGCFAELGYREGDLPVVEEASRSVLALPVYPELGEARQRRVVGAVASFYRSA